MRSINRALIRFSVAATGLVILSGTFLWCTAWRKLPHFDVPAGAAPPAPIMSGAEYEAVIATHARPYVYQLDHAGGALLVYGAEHSRDPADPQFADIERRWAAFRPTVALCESDLGILFPAFMHPIREFGEPGAVHALARRDGIDTYTWEPRREELVRLLLQRHSAEQVAARLILGPYFSNLRHGRPDDPEGFVEEYRAKRTRWTGLEHTFADMAAVDAYWRREFPDGPDWRTVSDEFGLPGFLATMDLNTPRDEHFATAALDLARRGERVFAICGSSHAVKIEPALRAAPAARSHPPGMPASAAIPSAAVSHPDSPAP